MSIVPNIANSNNTQNKTDKGSHVCWHGSMTLIERFAKQRVLNRLNQIQYGKLDLVFQDKRYQSGQKTEQCPLSATIFVHHPQFFVDIAFGGNPGSGESYMRHHWTTDNLTGLVQLMVRNEHVLSNMASRLAGLQKTIMHLAHKLNVNSHRGSKKNIAAHYDIGNDLFRLFLDPTMMYSSGLFLDENMTMEQASNCKLALICQRLQLSDSDHVLEIGTGWGGFAVFAAKNIGCHVTTTTISEEQYRYVEQLIKQHHLEDKITLLKQDYRKLEGQYDKLVSIEMIEAVGYRYMNTYIKQCSALLKPTGSLLIQSITIKDQVHKRYIKTADFIKRYIFPGGCLPCVSSITHAVQSHSDLTLFHLESFGESYARTLKEWRKAFLNKQDQVRQLGYNDAFIRLWEYYLCYCEGGFRERSIDVKHLIYTKPLSRLKSIVLQKSAKPLSVVVV